MVTKAAGWEHMMAAVVALTAEVVMLTYCRTHFVAVPFLPPEWTQVVVVEEDNLP